MITRVVRPSHLVATRVMVPTMARQIHGSPIAREKVGEKVRELGHKVNMKVGRGLASAIETGEKVTHATKEKLEGAEREVDQGKDYAEKKADNAAEGARKAKEDFKKELDK